MAMIAFYKRHQISQQDDHSWLILFAEEQKPLLPQFTTTSTPSHPALNFQLQLTNELSLAAEDFTAVS